MNKDKKIVDEKGNINNLGLFIQVVLIVLLICLAFMYIFIKELFLIIQIILPLLLFIMAYNNFKIYKRKYMTLAYLIVGIFILVTTVFNGING